MQEKIAVENIAGGAVESAAEMTTVTEPKPELKCNLVMKGGITSGIVYPAAVTKLAKKYRFRRIGGASAGAIAAALTAAAEYGRQSGGFERLQGVGEQLGQPGFLQSLFQPSPEARPLFEVALALKGRQDQRKGLFASAARGLRVIKALARHLTKSYLLGALLSALFSGLLFACFLWIAQGSFNVPLSLAMVVFVALFSVLGGLFNSVGGLVQIFLHRLTHFGICSGHATPSDLDVSGKLPFTDWLSEAIDHVAGSSGPLTFDDLERREVTLQMVTSNLSQERPYLLPFEQNILLFRETEMAQFFPEKVVAHLVEKRYQGNIQPPPGFHYLPPRGELPVVVAMRLSLSFPILISALPFYTVSVKGFANLREGKSLQGSDLQRNVFSDGGISSNFPIHFFDSWWPSHPTFGINLTSWPKDALKPNGELKEEYLSSSGANESVPSDGMSIKAVFMPPANRPDLPDWHEVTALTSFLGAIFSTSQNYRDQMQSSLPSYRERIVNIRLANNEGGLNLDMPAATIKEIMARGNQAGETMAGFDLSRHQWTRLNVLMSQLEQEFAALEKNFAEYGPSLDDLFELQRTTTDSNGNLVFPFRRNKAWCDKAVPRLNELRQLLASWQEEAVFSDRCPKPEPHLRISPRV